MKLSEFNKSQVLSVLVDVLDDKTKKKELLFSLLNLMQQADEKYDMLQGEINLIKNTHNDILNLIKEIHSKYDSDFPIRFLKNGKYYECDADGIINELTIYK